MKRETFIFVLSAAIVVIAATVTVRYYIIVNQDIARDRRLVKYYRSSIGKAFQWKAKEVIYGYNKGRRAMLVTPDDAGSLKDIRQKLDRLEDEIKLGMNWKHPIPERKLPRCKIPLLIDGRDNEPAWSDSLVFRGEYPVNHDQRRNPESEWKLMYDENYLYFYCNFSDSSLILAPPSALYEADSFELFIMPEIRYHTYVELVLSPNGQRYTRWVSQTDRGQFELSDYAPKTLVAASLIKRNGYSIEGRIGFQELPAYLRGNKARQGETIRLMMIRINKDASGNKVASTPVPFLYDGHNIYGYMILSLN